MSRSILRFLVPRDWTGDQALAAIALLRAASQAIWQVHGEDMADALGGRARSDAGWGGVHEDHDDLAGLTEDDIPF